MSLSSQIIDAVLAHVAVAVPGVTTRNALAEGFESDDQISLYPWCQGFAPAFTSAPEEDGQQDSLWLSSYLLLQEFNQGEAASTFLDDIKSAVAADWTLGGLVTRAIVVEAAVDDYSTVARTSTAFIVSAQIIR